MPKFVRRPVQEAAAVHGLSAGAAAAYCDLCRILVVEVVNDNVRNLVEMGMRCAAAAAAAVRWGVADKLADTGPGPPQ